MRLLDYDKVLAMIEHGRDEGETDIRQYRNWLVNCQVTVPIDPDGVLFIALTKKHQVEHIVSGVKLDNAVSPYDVAMAELGLKVAVLLMERNADNLSGNNQ